MKGMIVAAAVALLLGSCVSKQAVVAVEDQRDSLTQVVSVKDSLINAVFDEINAITENLAQIRSRENLIAAAGQDESGARPVEQIRSDIAAIDRLLQQNRTKIASLERAASQLRKANLRIGGLEKMIADLGEQLSAKRAEVEELRGKMDRMSVEVQNLTEQVAQRSAEVDNLSGEKIELENRLHTVHYIVGSEKELRDAQIIDKQGFIGRTLTASRNRTLESFTQADSRLLSEIPVGKKKVTVVTSHPEDSYELLTDGNKVVEKLLITDPTRFWERSRVLIVSYR